MMSVALSFALALQSCATAMPRPPGTVWQPVDRPADAEAMRVLMQYAPRVVVRAEGPLAEPESHKLLAVDAVAVQIAVTNVGEQSLRIKSGESALELPAGRRLAVYQAQRLEETKTPSEPPAEPTREAVDTTTPVDTPTPADDLRGGET